MEIGHFQTDSSFEQAYKKEGAKFVDVIEQIGIKFSKGHLSYVANLKVRQSEFATLCEKHSINAAHFRIPIGQKYSLQVALEAVQKSIDRSGKEAMMNALELGYFDDDLYSIY